MVPEVQDKDVDTPDRMRLSIVIVLAMTVLLAITATYLGASRLLTAQARSIALGQHALYLRSLNETIEQHQHLPFILAQNQLLTEDIAGDDGLFLNETLRGFSEAAGLEAVYIMTPGGDVVATSNFAAPDSFLGQNYGFRPYFRGALDGQYTDYFAIGATTGRPGYFVAGPLIASNGDLIGVIAIKLDISELQTSWEERGENVLAANGDGVVLVSSNRDWLYQTINPLSDARRDDILNSRQFADEALRPLNWTADAHGSVDLAGQSYFLTSGQTDLVDWTVYFLSPASAVSRQIVVATVILGSIVAALIGFAVFLRSRRIAAALAVSQSRRKALMQANARLLQAQDELSRTSKLAALGQLAASVTHELGQPISALKNHLLAAEIGNEITSPKTAENLKRLTARMEGITKQLRFFARRSRHASSPVDLVTVLREAIALLQHDADAADVVLEFDAPSDEITVAGEQLQLEQAAVNLIRNALQAAENTPKASVRIEIVDIGDSIRIDVTDTGSGLNGLTLDELQEPFFSTKSSGVGMGLGLAITSEIIRDHGGVLSAHESTGGGAVFSVTLPKTQGEQP